MITLKSIPFTYNKDIQEDKEPLFNSLSTVERSGLSATGVVSILKINSTKMTEASTMDLLATDLADYLVKRGVPFIETHHISGEAVRLAEEQGLSGIDKLTLEQYKKIDHRFEADVKSVFDFNAAVEWRTSIGDTAKLAVINQI